MEVYRISPSPFINLLNGEGARLYGGRWNSEGLSAIYATSYRSLALLETIVHLSIRDFTEREYSIATIELPDPNPDISYFLETKDLAVDWILNENISQYIGDQILKENKFLYIKVPSAIISEEQNIIINPTHPLMKNVKIIHVKKLDLDQRFLKIPAKS